MLILECIKGFADSNNINVMCMQGDRVQVLEVETGNVHCIGLEGWCMEVELDLKPSVIAECFKIFRSEEKN